MLAGIQEHYQLHLFLPTAAIGIILVLEAVHLVLQQVDLFDLAILTGVLVQAEPKVREDDPFLLQDVLLFDSEGRELVLKVA